MRHVTASTSDDVRRINLSRTLRQLHTDGQASRSDLVAGTGLNRSTVATLVAELAADGLVDELPGPAGAVGRPSLLVTPIPESVFVLAFDIGVERTVAAAIGLGGEVISRQDLSRKATLPEPEAAAQELTELAAHLLAELPHNAAWVGTGVSLPGVVDPKLGRIRIAPNLGWVDVDFAMMVVDKFTERFGAAPTTTVDNEANLGALAESVRGSAKEFASVVFISGDVGIGGGVIVEGALLTGSAGYAGEVGHMVINPQGRECRCGSRGCWETEIGSQAITRGAGGRFSDVRSVVEAARAGDEDAAVALKVVSDWLAIGLVNLANAYNPDAFILGGHLRYLTEFAEGAVQSQLQAWFDGRQHQLPLVEPSLGDISSLLGAGEASFEALLNDPLHQLAHSCRLVG